MKRRRPGRLSGGQRQRVAIGRAICAAFLAEGAKVAAADRLAQEAAETAVPLGHMGRPEEIAAVMAGALAGHGRAGSMKAQLVP
jgi:NAD(P)-dependent dehydrogenase (short-subunit alcohol dehydrogenase family)